MSDRRVLEHFMLDARCMDNKNVYDMTLLDFTVNTQTRPPARLHCVVSVNTTVCSAASAAVCA